MLKPVNVATSLVGGVGGVVSAMVAEAWFDGLLMLPAASNARAR
jgi:hypothetical protein